MKTKSHRSGPPKRKGTAAQVSITTRSKTVEELAKECGAKPFDSRAFAGIVPPGEDIGAFVEEIYRARA